jgi:preprotein translocase subunit SecE
VARVNPGEFLRQVRAETGKVVWATRKQTVSTALMVMIMTSILGVFFLGVDRLLGSLVKFLLSLASS